MKRSKTFKIDFRIRKTRKMDKKSKSEQLEEGEIIDDDEFEDISDNSIIESGFGKFVSPNENLRALPLSSDSEIDKAKDVKSKRKCLHHKSKLKLRRRRKRVRPPSESSDSDLSPPDDLKGKLKEAIRIADTDDSHKNPLEKRLKAMGGGSIITEPVIETTEPVITESASELPKAEKTVEKNDDAELENLRMEALKTAVLNKCQRRKRKKLEALGTTPTLENKENNTPKDSDKQNNTAKIVTNNAEDVEEDEDILRASLLAGLAKKISKPQPPENKVQVKKVAAKLPISVVSVLPKRPISQFKSNTVNKLVINKAIRPKPQVQPLIINVNDDSDSEDEIKAPTVVAAPKPPEPKAPTLSDISSNVEKFLKEQRAKFEVNNKPNVAKAALTNKTLKSAALFDKTTLEKSAVKLLPKSQQIEYEQLVKRLKFAERKKKAKKLALERLKAVKVEVKNGAAMTVETAKSTPIEVVIQPATTSQQKDVPKPENSRTKKLSETSVNRRSRVTGELTNLQKSLKEIKILRNGRFQIQSKYQVLTPIIRRITATSNERKKQEHRIKFLLQELNEARNNLSRSHERFSTLVKELLIKKEKLDKSDQQLNINGKIATKNKKLETETRKDSKALPVTSTPIKAPFNESDEATISTFLASSTNNDCEDMDVCNSDETDICQIDIVDPNDIDQIFKRKPSFKSAIPEYVSPLFNAYERYQNVDPHAIMCPYEVNGSCRDIDCTYKHYLKSHEIQ